MPQQLPLAPSIANYRVGTVLGGVSYLLDVRWNGRAEAWYLDVLTEDEEPIRRGIKLVLGSALGRRCVDTRFPPGILVAADTSGAGIDAGFDDMGERVVVLYFAPEEL